MKIADFNALANILRLTRPQVRRNPFLEAQLPLTSHFAFGKAKQWRTMRDALADYCQSQSPKFNRVQWLDYVNEGLEDPDGSTFDPPRDPGVIQ